MGQHLVFAKAEEVIKTISGVDLNAKQIERICHKYGQWIDGTKSESSLLEKFRKLEIHKRRKPLEAIAKELRPIIQGAINYYCKFSIGHIHATSGIN